MKPPKRQPAASPPKRRPGPKQPPYAPTEKDRKDVVRMVAAGIEQSVIGRCLGLTEKPLRRHFRDELDTSYAKIKAAIAGGLINAAIAGDVKAQMFYLETHGWTRSDRLTLVDGGAEVDVKTMSDTEVADRLAKVSRSPAVLRATKAATVH